VIRQFAKIALEPRNLEKLGELLRSSDLGDRRLAWEKMLNHLLGVPGKGGASDGAGGVTFVFKNHIPDATDGDAGPKSIDVTEASRKG